MTSGFSLTCSSQGALPWGVQALSLTSAPLGILLHWSHFAVLFLSPRKSLPNPKETVFTPTGTSHCLRVRSELHPNSILHKHNRPFPENGISLPGARVRKETLRALHLEVRGIHPPHLPFPATTGLKFSKADGGKQHGEQIAFHPVFCAERLFC